MSENLPNIESVAAKTGVDPEVVKAVLEAAAETIPAEAAGSGSSHKVELPLSAIVPSSSIKS